MAACRSAATARAWCKSRSFRRTPLGPSSRKMRAASSQCTSASVESYSKCPESKVPSTSICLRRGTTPAGVSWPLGAINVTGSPTRTPKARASSLPSTTPNFPACRRCKAARCSGLPSSVTSGSSTGSMPRTSTPRMSSPRASKACAAIKGAAPTTCEFWRACKSVCAESGKAAPSWA